MYHKKALLFSNSITCRLNVAHSSLSVALQEIWLGNIPWPGDIQQAFEQFIRVSLLKIYWNRNCSLLLIFGWCCTNSICNKLFSEIWALTPFGDSTAYKPHPAESCGNAMKLNMKIGMFYTRERKQSFFFLPQLFLLLIPPFSSCHLPPIALAILGELHHPFQPEHCCHTEQASALWANSNPAKHGAAERENSG